MLYPSPDRRVVCFQPRSSSSSSTSRPYRDRYQPTAQRIDGGSVWRQLKIVGRLAISRFFYVVSRAFTEVATQPKHQRVNENTPSSLLILSPFQDAFTYTGTMDRLTVFGLFAVTAMLVSYALERRSAWFILAFAGSCALGSVYGFLQGAWPFGLVEAIWSLVALQRWRAANNQK